MLPHSAARHDATRAIANALRRESPHRAPDADTALRILVRVLHGDRCPSCASERIAPRGLRRVRCGTCRATRSLTAGTPFHGTRVALATQVAAIWHIHVDSESTSAAAFGRRHRIRSGTALALFHDARAALVAATVRTASAKRRVLGGNSVANSATVAAAFDDDGELVLARAEETPPIDARTSGTAARWLGRLHAWIADVFRGVTRRRLHLYLAEFAARWRRVGSVRATVRARGRRGALRSPSR